MASNTAGADTSYFTPTTHFYLSKSIKIAKIFFLQRHPCFVSSCLCLETPLAARCEPRRVQGLAGGQAGVCTARPTTGDLATKRIRNLFSHEDQNNTGRKYNIAQSDPERQNCNNRKFSPKMQPVGAVIARCVCPHCRRQEGENTAMAWVRYSVLSPVIPCLVPCHAEGLSSGAPQTLIQSPPGTPSPTNHIQAAEHHPHSLAMHGNNAKPCRDKNKVIPTCINCRQTNARFTLFQAAPLTKGICPAGLTEATVPQPRGCSWLRLFPPSCFKL